MKRVLTAFAVILLLLMPSHAEEVLDTSDITDNTPPEVQQYLGDISPEDADIEQGAKSLGQSFLTLFKEQMKKACASGFLILGVCALIAILTAFSKSAGLNVSQKVIDMTGVCAVVTVCFSSFGSILTECAKAIQGIGAFAKALFPVFAAATAISGKPVSAVTTAGTTLLFSNIIVEAASKVFIPLIYIFIIVAAAGIMAENELLDRTSGIIKWLNVNAFKIILIIFTGYLSLSGIVAGSADAATVKAAKATLSGVVPVVGAIVADTSEAILSGAAVLKGAIGTFGFLGACAVCLVPFVRTLCHMIIFKVLSAVGCSFAGGNVSKMLDRITEAYGIALGLLGTCCAIQFISIVVSTVVIR